MKTSWDSSEISWDWMEPLYDINLKLNIVIDKLSSAEEWLWRLALRSQGGLEDVDHS